MEITKLQWLDKKKCIVYIDYEIAFVLYKGDLRKYDLNEGGEFSEEIVQEIMCQLLPKRAKLRLLHLLEKRDYTELQLRRKLEEGKYPEAVIEEALGYVKDYGYVNDKNYARRYFECYGERKSKGEIRRKLREKGISPAVIAVAIDEWIDAGGGRNEEGIIEALLIKRHFIERSHERKEWNKQELYLLGKGFDKTSIRRVMKRMGATKDLLDIT